MIIFFFQLIQLQPHYCMMSAGGAALEGAGRRSGRRPSSGSITASQSPPTRPAPHHRRARCVRDHCKATTVRPSVPLFQRDHGVQMSEMRQDGVFR